jgi:hypothetical protein
MVCPKNQALFAGLDRPELKSVLVAHPCRECSVALPYLLEGGCQSLLGCPSCHQPQLAVVAPVVPLILRLRLPVVFLKSYGESTQPE